MAGCPGLLADHLGVDGFKPQPPTQGGSLGPSLGKIQNFFQHRTELGTGLSSQGKYGRD